MFESSHLPGRDLVGHILGGHTVEANGHNLAAGAGRVEEGLVQLAPVVDALQVTVSVRPHLLSQRNGKCDSKRERARMRSCVRIIYFLSKSVVGGVGGC